MNLLAPDIVDIILKAAEPDGLTIERLLSPFSFEWPAQRTALLTANRRQLDKARSHL
jgi:hypothetical protein